MTSVNRPLRFCQFLLLVGGLAGVPMMIHAASLEVIVTGLKDPQGTVEVGLYHGKDSFPRAEGATMGESIAADTARDGTFRVLFPDVKPGSYAVAVYHDQNHNGKLDKGLFGIPSEGYGFSNDAKGFMGPPGFESAAFQVDEFPAIISVQLSY